MGLRMDGCQIYWHRWSGSVGRAPVYCQGHAGSVPAFMFLFLSQKTLPFAKRQNWGPSATMFLFLWLGLLVGGLRDEDPQRVAYRSGRLCKG